jgi:osmoprotectant transport system ATP-binding protein
MTEAIAFDDVSKIYEDGRVHALDGVSLLVPEREFVAVVGPSGSGKTTLLQLINRLAEPSSGTVRVDGEDVRAVEPIALRRRIGYVFQGVGLFPHMTVKENIAVTPRLLGWDAARRAARVDELLDLVRLARTYGERYPHQLSGGERQRIGVARAIAAQPHIVLMDEPFGALDPITRDAVGRDYRQLHDALGLTTVMITHDVLEAVLLADRVGVMQAGRLIAEGTPQALMSGAHGDYVDALMATPRRQGERLAALMERAAP